MSEKSGPDLLSEGEKHLPRGYDPQLYRIRHSAAHIMAQAARQRFAPEGPVRLAVGPPIENGFYYDLELPRPATEEDLAWIQARMKKIIREDHPFRVREVTPEEASEIFREEPYKRELIEGLVAGNVDENGNPLPAEQATRITVYQHDDFVDLCRGPHVRHTGEINPEAVKLLHVAGAYWRGDETRPMLQRIYGTAWETPEQLEHYLWQLAEAEKRDHRRLGRELELLHFDPTAPGMPYWLPNGFRVLRELIQFWRVEHEKRGYQEISTPLINDKQLWEISGHWEHYREHMFLIPASEQVVYGVKPMNCPNAMVVYNLKTRSYRDLPLRLSDCDLLHRNERSGTLHGLLRTREFQQDDAHIFITEEQIEEEYARVLEIAGLFYGIFDLKYHLRLGTRPDSFIGDVETWDRAEAALKRILDQHAGPGNYQVLDGDGAFYGPKIDIIMEDVLGRSWQMGTIQLDFQLPRRFQCAYIDANGQEKTPVVVHRVIYGSLERFMGILIEHTAGAFPVWLAPIQARIIPITDRLLPYAQALLERLQSEGLRAELDDSDKRMNAKIRDAQLQKIPYMLVVGNREAENGAVSVRLRTEEDLGPMPVEAFVQRAKAAIADKRSL